MTAAIVLLALSGPAAGGPVERALALQTNEQAVEGYRKAAEHVSRGAYAEGLRLCEELVKQRPDKEGMLRIRVGAGLEDREFEPRRLSGDACLAQAKNAADLEARQKLVDEAIRHFEASAKLGLKKSEKLLESARAERAKVALEIAGARGAELLRRKIEAAKKEVTEKVIAREFEAAFAALEKAKPQFAGNETAWEGIRTDLQAEFGRWHDGLVSELRRDLEAFRPDRVLADPAPTAERLGRYRIPAERAAPSRLDPLLPWGARLGEILAKRPPDPAAAESLGAEGARLGAAAWRAATGLALEALAAAVKDPGAGAPLEERWQAVARAQGAFAGAAGRARTSGKGAPPAARGEVDRWLAEDLTALERRVASVVKSLPDRDAPLTVEKCLARLADPAIAAGARPDGYAGVEAELREVLSRSTLEPPLRAKLLSGMAVARAHALFLEGAPREQVLERCAEPLRESARLDAAAPAAWKSRVSPRVAWVIEQAAP
jgi:hypothetical protein